MNRIIQSDNTIDGSDGSIWWTGLSPTIGAMLNRHSIGGGIQGGASVDYNNWVHTIIVREAGNNRIYCKWSTSNYNVFLI